MQYGAVHSVYLKAEFAILARISGTVWSHSNYRDSHITIKSRSNILHCVSRGAHSLAIMSKALQGDETLHLNRKNIFPVGPQ